MTLTQINLFVRDMTASLAFYRLLGVPMEPAAHPDWAPHHASGKLPNGVLLELDSLAFARQWNAGFDGQAPRSLGGVLFFTVDARDEVDRVFARLTQAGHRTLQRPEDGFWGARYAIVQDPDGHAVGLTSEVDPDRRAAPPTPPHA